MNPVKLKCSYQLLAVLLIMTFMIMILLQYIISHVHVYMARNTIQALKVSEKDDKTLKFLFKKLVETADKEGIQYFMFYGTLLGAFRHRGRIQYDDDIDVMIAFSDRERLQRRFNELLREDNIAVVETGDVTRSFKMFSTTHSREMMDKTWRYPFIDISFYEENDTHIWDTFQYDKHRKFLKSEIFPLAHLMFDGISANAPNDISAVLTKLYGDFHQCKIPYERAHRTEGSWQKNSYNVPCRHL